MSHFQISHIHENDNFLKYNQNFLDQLFMAGAGTRWESTFSILPVVSR